MAVTPSIRIRVQTRPKVRIRVTPALIPANATIEIGTVTTLPAGSSVTVVDVGTPGNAVFNFGIPRGDPGVVQSIVAGSNVSVDSSDPAHPIVSATGVPMADAIHGATDKPTPVDADEFGIADSAASFGLKKLTWANLKAGVLAYFNGTAKATPVNADRVWQGDSTTSFTPVYSTWTQVKAFLFASPTLTGTPLSTTAAVDTNTTQIATTAMVLAQAAAATPLGNKAVAVVGTATRFARADHVHPGRETLTANRSYFVRTDGSDSNTGLVNNAGGAFLTMQKAMDIVAALDISIYNVTISVADGTYTGGVNVIGPWLGSGTVILSGNVTTPANVLMNVTGNCVFVQAGGRLSVQGLKLQCTGVGLWAFAAGAITVSGLMDFGACSSFHAFATQSGNITFASAWNTTGSATASLTGQTEGVVNIAGQSTTVVGTPAFSSAYASFSLGAMLLCNSFTFSGAGATGPRYTVTSGGMIGTFSGNAATYLPGNAAGSVSGVGSQYF